MSAIEDLLELMPLPAVPLEVPTADDWRRCGLELVELPDDYKQFLTMYGTGVVDDFLWVFNPAAENQHLNLFSQVRTILSALEESSRKFPNVFAMLRFPAANGFLPFAGTDNGDNIFWVVNGDNPNKWTIAVMGPRSPDVYHYNSGFVSFLVAMIRSDVHCRMFPSDFPVSPPILFVPAIE